MKREEYIFTIGYEGDVAIVDKRACGKYRTSSVTDLAEAGMFKAAFCAALYAKEIEESGKEMEQLFHWLAEHAPSVEGSIPSLKRLFGTLDPPKKEESAKIKVRKIGE